MRKSKSASAALDEPTAAFAKRIGHAIREQRKRLGLSQQDVADVAGVSVNLQRQIEAGKESARLSKLLDVIAAVGLEIRIGIARSERRTER